MKKTVFVLALFVGVAASALAQGTVVFSNAGLATEYRISTQNWAGASGYISGNNAYRIGLYAGLLGTRESLSLVGLATNFSAPALAGYFRGGDPFVINGLGGAGAQITFQLRAWSFAGGLSWEEALSQALSWNNCCIAIGESTIGTTTLGGGGIPAGSLWSNTNPNGITGFTLGIPTPEPSSVVLSLLGLGAFALCRRRK